MRTVRLGLASAVSLLSLAAPFTAHAAGSAGGAILYVGKSAACTDSGQGLQTAPFCTVQAAVNAAQPGDTVSIGAGSYAQTVSVTDQADAADPLTITATQPSDSAEESMLEGLDLTGASNVTVEGLVIQSGGVTVDASHSITLDQLQVLVPRGVDGVHVTGSSTGVTISRTSVSAEGAPDVAVDPGSGHVVITTNVLEDGLTATSAVSPVTVTGATGTDIVSNTLLGQTCAEDPRISLSGGSTGSVIENNVLTLGGTGCDPTQPGVLVAADSLNGTVSDYNDIDAVPGTDLYNWNGIGYATLAKFQSATGQGEHDLDADPVYGPTTPFDAGDFGCDSAFQEPEATSPLIGSADALAPGELSTDINGVPQQADPQVANTGTGVGYYDRGAVDREFCLSAVPQTNQLQPDSPRTVQDTTALTTTWPAAVSEMVQWGDGTSTTQTVHATGGETADGIANPVYVHTYGQSGTYQVTVTATVGTQRRSYTQPITTLGSDYIAITPDRVLDTRNGTGTSGSVKPVAAHGMIQVQVADGSGLPSGQVTAAVLNITAVDAKADGFLSSFPLSSSTNPSFLNYTRGQAIANQVTVPVDDGSIDIYNGSDGTVDLVADLQGYYTRSGGSGFVPAAPTRLLDTRTTSATRKAGQVPADGTVTVRITGSNGIPATGVSAVVINTTETDAGASGFITAYPGGGATPTASNLNFIARSTVSNLVTVAVGAGGTVTLYNGSSRPVDLVADLQGYYTQGSGLAYIPDETRLWDTRTAGFQPLAARQDVGYGTDIGYWGVGGSWYTPTAVLVNNTVVVPEGSGYLAVTPVQTGAPKTSNVSFGAGETIAGADMVGLKAGAPNLYFYNGSAGAFNLVTDLEGYFA